MGKQSIEVQQSKAPDKSMNLSADELHLSKDRAQQWIEPDQAEI